MSGDKLILQIGNRTVFAQYRRLPSVAPVWAGNYMEVGGISNPSGEVNVIETPSPKAMNQWDRVGVTRGERGLASGDLNITTSAGVVRKLSKVAEIGDPINAFIVVRDTGRADTFIIKCLYKILYEDLYMTAFNEPVSSAQSGGSNGIAIVTIPVSGVDTLYLFPQNFGRVAASATAREVIDGMFIHPPYPYAKNSNQFFVTVIDSDGAAIKPKLVMSDDSITNIVSLDVSPMLFSESPLAIESMHNHIIVVQAASGEYHYISAVDALDGVNTWASITALGSNITAIKVHEGDGSLMLIGCANGDIRQTNNPAVDSDLLFSGLVAVPIAAIDMYGETMVAITNDAKVVLSRDMRTAELQTIDVDGTPVAGTSTSVSIINDHVWVVAVGSKLYFTENQGRSYESMSLPSTITDIPEVVFRNSVGYAVANTATTPLILRTESLGAMWSYSTDKSGWVEGMPTVADTLGFVALHEDRHTVLAGGLTTTPNGLLLYAAKD